MNDHFRNVLRGSLTALFDGDIRCALRHPYYLLSLFSANPDFWLSTRVSELQKSLPSANLLSCPTPHGLREMFDALQYLNTIESVEQEYPASSRSIGIKRDFVNSRLQGHRYRRLDQLLMVLRCSGIRGIDYYLHGSVADATSCAFSDVDDFVIVRREAWSDYDNFREAAFILTQIAREFQRIDPLQHHGHILVTEYDLQHYDGSLLPMHVLEKESIKVIGKDSFYVTEFYVAKQMRQNALNCAKALDARVCQAMRKGSVNLFELKKIIGEVLLLPAYVLQSFQMNVTKPEALLRASELYSTNAMNALVWASAARKGFCDLLTSPRICLLRTFCDVLTARRRIAETIFVRFSPSVPGDHEFGINADIARKLTLLVAETSALLN